MELKRVIENLEVKNAISNDTVEELIKKYCSTKEDYERFLKIFARIFVGRQLYPILISDKYDKLIKMIECARTKGINKNAKDSLAYEEAILNEISYHQNQTVFDIHGEDFCQAHALFESSIASSKNKSDKSSFAEKIKKMYNCALIAQSDDELSASDFGKTAGTLKALKLPKEERLSWLEAYYREHPKAKLCCDVNFLYFANYVLKSHPSSCTEDFINLIKSVSSITMMSYEEIAKNNFSIDDYKRVLKKVNQNIASYENKKSKENKPKTKIKDFFDRKRPN